MNIQTEKIELIKLLLEIDNPSVIQSIKNIFSKNKSSIKSDWTDVSKQEIEAIKEGLKDAESGNLIAHENIMAKYKKKKNGK